MPSSDGERRSSAGGAALLLGPRLPALPGFRAGAVPAVRPLPPGAGARPVRSAVVRPRPPPDGRRGPSGAAAAARRSSCGGQADGAAHRAGARTRPVRSRRGEARTGPSLALIGGYRASPVPSAVPRVRLAGYGAPRLAEHARPRGRVRARRVTRATSGTGAVTATRWPPGGGDAASCPGRARAPRTYEESRWFQPQPGRPRRCRPRTPPAWRPSGPARPRSWPGRRRDRGARRRRSSPASGAPGGTPGRRSSVASPWYLAARERYGLASQTSNRPGAPGVHVGQDGSPLQRVVHDGSTSGHCANVRNGRPRRPVTRRPRQARRPGRSSGPSRTPAPARLLLGPCCGSSCRCSMYRLDTSITTIGRRQEGGVLEFAILGLLQQSPMHGYELRKELAQVLGRPAQHLLRLAVPGAQAAARGRATSPPTSPTRTLPADAPPLTGRRGKVVYTITAEGKERFHELVSQTGPEAYDDGGLFGVHLAFFRHTAGRRPAADPRGTAPHRRAAARGSARRRWPAPASGWTATPSSCSATAWSRWTARSAGCPSSSTPSGAAPRAAAASPHPRDPDRQST